MNSNKKLSTLSLTLAIFFSTLAQAAPVGGVVAAGGATITSTPGNTTINQSTPKAIINWQGFNVGTSESVRFNQPSSSAIVLNRVVGADGSSIMGNISANGRVFLINPNGIVFGSGSQVNVGGMVASTLGITDANFLAGNYRFTGDSSAALLNQGVLNTNVDGGYIALLGANVSNTGVITARLGTVALAAGNGITLDVAGDHLLNVSVDQGAVNALVSNGHLIIADGGQVLMTARGASSLLSNAVNNTGLIQAQSIENINGLIILSAGPDVGVVNVSGNLDASGTRVGQTGGSVQLLGGTVNLASANINVSGHAGGGQALVGGNFNGAGPQPNALFTNIDSTSSINADALQTGNGGKIAVWSDNTTYMAGTLTARGGALSGDGGFIETSGKHLTIANSAYINTLAINGKTGMWLLDPLNWTIATTGGDETPAQVETSLASSNRTITATNDINVNNALTWSTLYDLTLDAGHDVNINAAITASTAGAQLNLKAGNDVVIVGAITASGAANQINVLAGRDITVTAIAPIPGITASAAGTQINMMAGRNLSVDAITTDGGGSMTLRANGNVSIGAASAAASPGTVSLYADNDGSGSGTVVINRSIAASNTIIRFNPATYLNTSVEVADYKTKIAGASSDVKAWVFINADNKIYNQMITASMSFKGTPTDASAVELSPGTASFLDRNVGNGKTVSYSAYSLGGVTTNLALYSETGTSTANITPATLVVSATGIDKVYNASTGANVNLTSTAYAIDNIAFTSTAAFNNKDVGTSVPVAVSEISVSSGQAGNYFAPNASATTSANITPATLVVSATGIDKVYNASTGANVNLTSTAYAIDNIAFTSTAAFNNKDVGTSVPVAVSEISVSSGQAGNYFAPNASATTSANITPATLVVSATGIDKVYNASTGANVNLTSTAYAIDNIAFTSTAAFNNKDVGTSVPVAVSEISVSSGQAGNYFAPNASATTSANITPATLVVSATGIDKVYNASTGANVNLTSTAYAIDNIAFTSTAAFNNKDVGTSVPVAVSEISVSSGQAGNYFAPNASATTSANITPATLVVSATGIDKVYNASTGATAILNMTPLAGDSVSSSYAEASFDNPLVGINKPVSVTGITLGGIDAMNYLYNTTAFTTADITPTNNPTPPPPPHTPQIIPIVPPGISNQAPTALQRDMDSDMASPLIANHDRFGGMLEIADPQSNAEMHSLFPAAVIAPFRTPKQGRN